METRRATAYGIGFRGRSIAVTKPPWTWTYQRTSGWRSDSDLKWVGWTFGPLIYLRHITWVE